MCMHDVYLRSYYYLMFTEAVLLTPFARSTKMTARIDAMTPPAETETADRGAKRMCVGEQRPFSKHGSEPPNHVFRLAFTQEGDP